MGGWFIDWKRIKTCNVNPEICGKLMIKLQSSKDLPRAKRRKTEVHDKKSRNEGKKQKQIALSDLVYNTNLAERSALQ